VRNEDTYKTIAEKSEGIFKDKGSKFIAFIYPVSSEEQIKEIVQAIKKEHFSARHHCYAYRLGNFGEKHRSNDDGEPSGTAGKPIFGQLLSNGLTNVLIVVVRYFGGTLLGVSGLIQAYKSAATDAIMNATIVTTIIENKILLRFGYPLQNTVMKVIKDEQLTIENSEFGMDCKLYLAVRKSKTELIVSKLQTINGLKITELNC
jgi:uncharacterized YigZ family protein